VGILAVAYANQSAATVSLAPLYFLPLALSALIHPLRIGLALSIVCLVLHEAGDRASPSRRLSFLLRKLCQQWLNRRADGPQNAGRTKCKISRRAVP
jgi:hypothetical protein